MGDRTNAFFKSIRLAILLLILALVPGCGKEPVELPLCDAGNYFPLDKGNWWAYRKYRIYDDGSQEELSRDSFGISHDTLMLGYRFHLLEGSFHSRPLSHWLMESDGKIVASDGCLFFRCPQLVQSEHLYPVYHFDLPARIRTYRKDTTLEIPAGTFKQVVEMEAVSMIDDTIPVVTYRFWFARGTGLIKWEAWCQDCTSRLVSELEKSGKL
jgi:hypothetical protein